MPSDLNKSVFGSVGAGLCGTTTAFCFGAGASEGHAMPTCKVKCESCGAVLPAAVALSCSELEDADLQARVVPSVAFPLVITAITTIVQLVHTCSHV